MPLDSTTYETPVMALLRRARSLLSRRGSWSPGGLAIDKEGKPVEPTDSEAAAFCMLGALAHETYGGDNGDLYHEACRELATTIKPRDVELDTEETIAAYNDADHRQKRTILRAFDRTIARIRALVTTA